MPPKIRVVRKGESHQDRAAQRANLGNLRSLVVSPSMLKRYENAVLLFQLFVRIILGVAIATNVEELDSQLVGFIEAAWLEGEPMATASDAICGVQHFMNRKRCFPGAWRYYTTWTKHELPLRTPPLPWIALLGIVGSMVETGEFEGAALALLGFHCFLRTSELLGVCVGHVTWTVNGLKGAISLPLTKSAQRTGSPESTTFNDGLVGALLEFVSRGRAPGDRIWRRSACEFRRLWKLHVERIGLNGKDFLPYCLRRGGATHHYIETGDLASTQHRGRWSSYKACRVYVVEGQRELQEAALTAAVRRNCSAAAQALHRLYQVLSA